MTETAEQALRLDAKAFRENNVYDSDGNPIRLVPNAVRMERAADTIADLLEVLEALFASYKELADSGDCGNWYIEDTQVGKQALAAIARAKGEA